MPNPTPPLPPNEAERLVSLRAYGILDTAADPRFDAITRLAARVLGMPIALVSLVDHDRQWAKSAVGLPTGSALAREFSFCAYALLTPQQPLLVEDAWADGRFANNPFVTGAPGVRAYAGFPLLDTAGRALGTLCVIDTVPRRLTAPELDTLRDMAAAASSVLELHRSFAELQESEAHHRAVIELSPQIPWTASPHGSTLEFSARVRTVTGLHPEQLYGDGWGRVVHPSELSGLRRRWVQAVNTGAPFDVELRVRVADGSYRWYRAYAAPRRDGAGRIVRWYGTCEDIHERKRSQAQIVHMAYHDSLTGLPNGAQLRALLKRHLARADWPFALLSIDLDNFKAVNDTLGHTFGDALLRSVAQRLRGCVGEGGTLARMGGDEFFIVHPLGEETPAALAACVLEKLRGPLDVDGHVLTLAASIGVVVAPRDGGDPDTLFHNADLALYRAKAEGRCAISVFDPAMGEQMRTHQALKLELGMALARDEFSVVFQPIVNVRTGQVDCFEALLRWTHPVRGGVSPADFIPAAEESGLIVPLGAWVLERACCEAAQWPGGIRVAVNLSSVQFRHRDLLQKVQAALTASGLAPERLELEVTESVLLLDDDDSMSVLHACRALGIRIAMDDFGTGYSSLSYLQRFPFDKLKIDRSFISRLTLAEEARAITRAILGMSRALCITTTAEGVETWEEYDLLRAEGCDQVQGFLFSRPVPGAEVSALVERLGARPVQQVAL